ncbi:MAG: 23S rRNA (uracil(1939)-C(5))-methyltransferase RlmD [Clostridia bacterium]|nr:23S rRNA (uracil(1939)-C(5))-methyltransferase RlmD [Clostridia bacterium]
MKKNDIVHLSIESLSSDGSGVGRAEGLVVFVPLSCAGDEIQAHILKVKKTYAYAKIHRILNPSPDRIEEDCAVYRQCGGCAFRHMRYEAELRQKQKMADDALARIGGLDLKSEGILSLSPMRYRNKAQYPIREEGGRLKAGFFAKHSHRVIDCEDCLLEPEVFGKVVQALQWFMKEKHISAYDESSHTGLVRHLFLRCSKDAAQLALCLVLNGEGLPFEREFAAFMSGNFPAIKSIMLNVNTQKTNVILGNEYRCIFGSEAIEDTLLGKRFRIGAAAFYQVNHDMCEKLYTKAAEYAALQPGETLLDLYCGAGTVGICLAGDDTHLIGVEIVPEAAENAQENAALNDLKNAEFICADAAAATTILKEKGLHADCVVIDPPRKGCDEQTIDNIAAFGAQRLVYISCNPATLARDLKIFESKGYKAVRACAADMFPRTAHCETVVLLRRKNIDDHLEFTWTDKDFGRQHR